MQVAMLTQVNALKHRRAMVLQQPAKPGSQQDRRCGNG
jgi:hypothetical protein